jgi:hypothetical protein
LLAPESGEVWDRFEDAFDFKRGPDGVPGICEPTPSVTWSLGALRDDPGDRKVNHLTRVVQDGLAACTPPGTALLVLEWYVVVNQML